jgi:hypothetical protein
MNAYDVRYKKQYSGFSIFGDIEHITAERKLAQLIDSSWHHSWHWPNEIDRSWVESVKEDLNTELNEAKERLNDLELAREILSQIDV